MTLANKYFNSESSHNHIEKDSVKYTNPSNINAKISTLEKFNALENEFDVIEKVNIRLKLLF